MLMICVCNYLEIDINMKDISVLVGKVLIEETHTDFLIIVNYSKGFHKFTEYKCAYPIFLKKHPRWIKHQQEVL